MRNGTIASFLFGDTKPSWDLRTRIALGITRGLVYLNEECTTQIIHCDIKPHNVLLDECYNAKISNFGMAKLLMVDQSHTLTRIRGTKGFVALEWFRSTGVMVKIDVYSFGTFGDRMLSKNRGVFDGNLQNLQFPKFPSLHASPPSGFVRKLSLYMSIM
ncbi:hypothetical protein LguiA_021726 [Lonicera macranthoides]